MQYLTQNELRRTEAIGNWKPRKLTEIEQLIKTVPGVFSMPNGTQAEKAKKTAVVDELVANLTSLTSTTTLGAKVQLACYQQTALSELLAGYPQVEFYDLLNGGNTQFSSIEKFAMNGFSMNDLQSILAWVHMAVWLMDDLPMGVDTFISTPHTDYELMRTMAVETKEAKYYGYVLPPKVQANVDNVFNENGFRGGNLWAIFHLRNFGLLDIASIWKRAKMVTTQQSIPDDVTVQFKTVECPRFRKYHEVELARTSTNTRLHFCIPG